MSRRLLLAGAGMLAATSAASDACSLTPSIRPVAASAGACRRSLQSFVDLLRAAPALPDDDARMRLEELGLVLEPDVYDRGVEGASGSRDDLDLIRRWTLSSGRRDRSPIAISAMTLLKTGRGTALFQFTLRRDLYDPGLTEEEAAGGCTGPYGAGYVTQDASYLGLFRNNRLREVSTFDAWLRTA